MHIAPQLRSPTNSMHLTCLLGLLTSCSGRPAPNEFQHTARQPFQAEFSPEYFYQDSWQTLPDGPDGEQLPSPHLVISLTKDSGRILHSVVYGEEVPALDQTISFQLSLSADAVKRFKDSFAQFSSTHDMLGDTTTWIVPSKETDLETLILFADPHTSLFMPSPTDIVVWRTGQGAKLFLSHAGVPLLLDLYSEYLSDGYPMLILNRDTQMSCAISGPFDRNLVYTSALTAAAVRCIPVESDHAVAHVRVGVCVQPSMTWGDAIEAIDSKLARVSEIVLLMNCREGIDSTLDLSLSGNRNLAP